MEKVTGADFKSATADDNKKLFIETYGCQMNVADSEVIASVMQMAGYSVADTLEEADAVFMNTCSIRDNAEQKILNRLEFFHSMKKNKRRNLIVGVLGCMAERVKDDLIENHHVDLVVGPDAYLTLPDLVASVEAGEKAINVELSTTETYREVIPSRICGNHISGFVSIFPHGGDILLPAQVIHNHLWRFYAAFIGVRITASKARIDLGNIIRIPDFEDIHIDLCTIPTLFNKT